MRTVYMYGMDERPSVSPFIIKGMGILVNWQGKGVSAVVMVKARTTMEDGLLSHRRHKSVWISASFASPPATHRITRWPWSCLYSTGLFNIPLPSLLSLHCQMAETSLGVIHITRQRSTNHTLYAPNQHGVQCCSTWMTARNGALELQSIQ